MPLKLPGRAYIAVRHHRSYQTPLDLSDAIGALADAVGAPEAGVASLSVDGSSVGMVLLRCGCRMAGFTALALLR